MSINFRTRSVSYSIDQESMMGACCHAGGCSYINAKSCGQKNNSTFHHNLNCHDIDCNLGVCCTDGLCSETTLEGCVTQNGTWVGGEFDCSSFDCSRISSEPLQACCLDLNTCKDLKPSECLALGGSPRGANSTCSVIDASGGCGITGATAYGVCCVDGNCLERGGNDPNGTKRPIGYTAGDCSALGGLWGGSGSTCGSGTSFDTSWPCSWPTGACCFGNSPIGGITYCDSGLTYGDCLNPPSLGGSGGAGWLYGVTCDQVTEITSPDGELVACSLTDEESGACCIPEYSQFSLEGPFENQTLIVDYICYQTSIGACTSSGGIFSGGVGCDEIDCCSLHGDCSGDVVGCCGQYTESMDGSQLTRECNENETITSCQAKKDVWWQNVEDPNDWRVIRFGFSNACEELESLAICPTDNPYGEDYQGICCGFLPPWSSENPSVCELEFVPDPQTWDDIGYSGTCPLHPENHGPGYIWSELLAMRSDNAVFNCEICTTSPLFATGACCFNGNCSDTIRQNCSGDFYEGLNCSDNCGFLPCCNGSGSEINLCVNETLVNADEHSLNSYSSCFDKYSFSVSQFNQETAMNLIDDVYQNIEAYNIYENPLGDCESCSTPCSRNRGSCCWNGNPIFNTTRDECNLFGGVFMGCEGSPFNKASIGGLNYDKPTIDCSEVSYGEDIPTNVRAVAIPKHGKTRLRRGPFKKDNIDLCAATQENWNELNWENGSGLGEDNADININANVDQLPTKPIVQIFWNSASTTQRNYRSGREGNILGDLDNVSICNDVNLQNCPWPLDKLGTCCIRNNNCGDDSRLNSTEHICYECHPELTTQCECAILNKQRSCNDMKWIPEEIDPSKCPCQDINNSEYQTNFKCVTESTSVNDNTLNEGEN